MKKHLRSDKGIEYIKLLSEHSKMNGIFKYTEDAINNFGQVVQSDLLRSSAMENRIRGLRAEELFVSVVAGIGSVILIKNEDCGDVYYSGDKISVPDFRVVLSDGDQLLIEIKAVSNLLDENSKFKLSDSAVKKLKRYSNIVDLKLKVAIYWERMNLWTLNKFEAFVQGKEGEQNWSISLTRAMATSEMSLLGDCMILTTSPIRVRMYPCLNTKNTTSKPKLEVEIYSENRKLYGCAAQIAWKLIRYGEWICIENNGDVIDGNENKVEFIYVPAEFDGCYNGEHIQSRIGSLSSMICNAYLNGASNTIHTNANDEILEPGVIGRFIPQDFVQMKLDIPLVLFEMAPNYDYKD